jgi:hypothetical protein
MVENWPAVEPWLAGLGVQPNNKAELDDASSRANARDQGDLFSWADGHLKIGRTLAQDGIRNASIRKARNAFKAALAELDRIEAKAKAKPKEAVS